MRRRHIGNELFGRDNSGGGQRLGGRHEGWRTSRFGGGCGGEWGRWRGGGAVDRCSGGRGFGWRGGGSGGSGGGGGAGGCCGSCGGGGVRLGLWRGRNDRSNTRGIRGLVDRLVCSTGGNNGG